MSEDLINAALEIIQPVMEGSMILAAEYAKECGRDFITGDDVKYALRYAAQNYVGNHTGTLFPELQDESDSDEDDIEIIDEEENCFTRYEGDNDLMNKVNEAYDTWDNWEPTNLIEQMLQDAVNKNN